MLCTGLCVVDSILFVGNLLNNLWNSPLRKVLEDLARQPQLIKLPQNQ